MFVTLYKYIYNESIFKIPMPSTIEILKRSLAVVFVHEFGHALGLSHEPDVSDSVMRPIYSGWSETVILSLDDIKGIQELYG